MIARAKRKKRRKKLRDQSPPQNARFARRSVPVSLVFVPPTVSAPHRRRCFVLFCSLFVPLYGILPHLNSFAIVFCKPFGSAGDFFPHFHAKSRQDPSKRASVERRFRVDPRPHLVVSPRPTPLFPLTSPLCGVLLHFLIIFFRCPRVFSPLAATFVAYRTPFARSRASLFTPTDFFVKSTLLLKKDVLYYSGIKKAIYP